MKGDRIPDQHHVSRFCKPRYVAVSSGEVQATAFMIRQDEESLSVNWLEALNCSSRECELSELQEIYQRIFDVKPRARIAIINVGEVLHKVLTESPDKRKLRILHDSSDNDPSHSGIYNLRYDDELIAEMIRETIRVTYPARLE